MKYGPCDASPELWAKLKPLAREMRHQPTPAEEILWQRLRNRQIHGAKFRRQHPIERFIVDFYCAAAKLVIEVDGSIYDYTPDQDAARQQFIEAQGLMVIRFSNEDVLRRTDAVIGRIAEVLQERL